MTMDGMEERGGSFSASMTDERSGKYLLPHKYSFAVPKGSVWDIWGSQKKPGVMREPGSNWFAGAKGVKKKLQFVCID